MPLNESGLTDSAPSGDAREEPTTASQDLAQLTELVASTVKAP
jgi:hypothetical protein